MTNTKISLIKFENSDIITIIKAVDPCKAHGFDDISKSKLKVCVSAIIKPLALSIHQSGFHCNDSCINRLLCIVHYLYKAFHAYPTLDARSVFLDMSKAFDKVWHEGLIYQLKSMGVSDSLLKLIKNFSTNRFQRILLNGQTSE